MKKLIFSAILFIGMGTMAFAQQEDGVRTRKGPKMEQKTAEERAQAITDQLDKKLSLTDDQKNQIYAINLESMNKAKENRVADREEARAAMKAAMQEREVQIDAVLDGTQKEAYQEFKKEKMDGQKKHFKKGKSGRGSKG